MAEQRSTIREPSINTEALAEFRSPFNETEQHSVVGGEPENNCPQSGGRTASLCLHLPIPHTGLAQSQEGTSTYVFPSAGKAEWGKPPASLAFWNTAQRAHFSLTPSSDRTS